jgi:D-serine deaminase-like pyridoxal phosphate-dependent protein
MKKILGKSKNQISTPALLLDIGIVEQNIVRMADFFKDKPCRLRPHCKTHKLPLLAKKQIEAGAIGITCATIEEAEVMAKSGIKSILIANQLVTSDKIERFVALSKICECIVCIDDLDNAKQISKMAHKTGTIANILIEINCGLNRCGVSQPESALELIKQIVPLEGISFRGLMGYEGGLFTYSEEEKKSECNKRNQSLIAIRDLLEQYGHHCEIVSAGGSNTYYITGLYPKITEIQPGSYVTMDSHNTQSGLDFGQALTVMATVISRPEKNRIVIDVGKKALSCDEGIPKCIQPGLSIFALNEEHGHVRIENPDMKLNVGDKIEIIPSHGCTTIPLYNCYHIINNRIVVSVEEIIARGY